MYTVCDDIHCLVGSLNFDTSNRSCLSSCQCVSVCAYIGRKALSARQTVKNVPRTVSYKFITNQAFSVNSGTSLEKT